VKLAIAVVVLTLLTASGVSNALSQPGSPFKRCGTIRVLGKPLAVDITEGRFPLSCEVARVVMRRYFARGARRNDTVRYQSMKFDCYRSRRDGVGWDYHCSHLTRTQYVNMTQYVDIGAGRR